MPLHTGEALVLRTYTLGESDRIVVLFRGRNVGGGPPHELTRERVGHLMTGTAVHA